MLKFSLTAKTHQNQWRQCSPRFLLAILFAIFALQNAVMVNVRLCLSEAGMSRVLIILAPPMRTNG